MIKWPNFTPIQDFCSGFEHTNRVSSNIYQKFDLRNVYIFEYEQIKRFV